MFKRLTCIAVLGSLLLVTPLPADATPEIVGAPKCKICHRAKTGDQWTIWTESAHAGAFQTLASDQSASIAAEMGLGDPREETACLLDGRLRAPVGKRIGGRGPAAIALEIAAELQEYVCLLESA